MVILLDGNITLTVSCWNFGIYNGKKPSEPVKTLRHQTDLFFKSRPGFEGDNASGSDGDFLACFWIPAGTNPFVMKLEFTKSGNFYELTLL